MKLTRLQADAAAEALQKSAIGFEVDARKEHAIKRDSRHHAWLLQQQAACLAGVEVLKENTQTAMVSRFELEDAPL